MQLMLLGPLQLVDDAGESITVTGPRQRILLAALAAHANQVVSLDALTELVWDGVPPPGGIATLRTHLARLRRCLGPRIGRRIVTRAPGYAIELGDDELDLLAFEGHCRRAGAALRAADNAQASASGALALSLWRGEPLSDVPSQPLRDLVLPKVERQRVQAAEDWIEAELRLGHHEPVLVQIRDLTARYPLRERFQAQLMLALAHTGRRAEALTAYQDARKTLAAELGVEPGRELRALHERILAGDEVLPDTVQSGDQASARPPAAEVPRQLPAAAGHFTGRGAELAWLTALAPRCDPQGAGDTVVIAAIDGMAGIGKTALAVHAAHRVAGQFPDGQLFVDLHGYTAGHSPRDPGDALGLLLRALQVPAERIPEDTQERAALYRQRLAGTRTLILLDNAADEAQVRPLLPAAPSCLVLVTSRRRLKGLDDARGVSLELLTPGDAVMLLDAVAGPGRVPADDPLLDEIARQCGRLPLALRIAAALLRHRPAWNLEHLSALLRDEQRRVSALSDGERNLATVFDLSYMGLSGQHRLLLRRLGLVPGPDTDAYAAAALLGADPDTATRLLEDLADHNLLIAHAPRRYRLHDLIRAHARTLAATDPVHDRDAALDRLLCYYAHTAHSASIPITRRPRPAPGIPAPVHAPTLADPETARAWLRAERDNLEHAYSHVPNLTEHILALAAGLAEILRTDGPYTRALALHQAAVDTAEHLGRPAAHANALTDLGIARRLTGDLAGADDAFAWALEIYRATGDRHGEADALTELGRARGIAGDLAGAIDAFARALEIYRATGDRHGEADMLTDLGIVRRVTGDLAGTVDAFARALEIYRAVGDRHGEADALTELGRARALTGDLAGADDALGPALKFYRATGHHHGEAYALTNFGIVRRLSGDLTGADDALGQALEIYRTIGYSQGEAEALANLGIIRRLSGDPAGARDAQAAALEIYRKIGSRHDEAWALNHYAATIAACGDLPRSLTLYQQALSMNRELNKPDGQSLAVEGIGEYHLTAGQTESGATYLRQALEIFQRLGMAPDAERVGTRLAGLATALTPSKGSRAMRRSLLASVAVLVAAALAACGSNPGSSGTVGGPTSTLTISNSAGTPWNCALNPFNLDSLGAGITMGQVYEPLMFVDTLENAKITPWLASSYAWSNGNRTLTFTVQKDVTFSDGKPMTAADVAFTFNLLKKFPALDVNSVWTVLSSVSQAGDTVVMRFKTSSVPYFYYIADQVPIVPEHIWASIKDPVTYVDSNPVGTGAYTVSSCTPQNITYLANPHYWQHGLPKVAKVLYPAFASNDQANTYLATGQAQWGSQFIPNIGAVYESKSPNNHYWFAPIANVSLIPNLTVPGLNSVAVRQAIAYALDRSKIASVGEYGEEPEANQNGIDTPTFSSWLDTVAEEKFGYGYNPARAQSLLRRAGYVKGSDGIYAKGGRQLSFTAINIAGYSDWVASMEVIQSELKAVGIGLTVENLAQNDFFSKLQSGNYQFAYYSQSGGPTPYYEFRQWLYSANSAPIGKDAATDWERYRSPATDKLLDSYASTTSAATQHAIVDQLQQVILSDVPYIPVTEGVAWFQYNTASFTGWPSQSDPYAIPAVYAFPDMGQVLLHLSPK